MGADHTGYRPTPAGAEGRRETPASPASIAIHPHDCVRAAAWRVESYGQFHESRARSGQKVGEDKSSIQCCHTVVKRHFRK